MPEILIGEEGGPRDNKSIPLSTKQGTWIRNVRKAERAPESMKAAERIYQTKFPNRKTRSLSATYNCFGLVFASRRTWILDPQQVDQILREDGYYKIQAQYVVAGDLVVYRIRAGDEITHVGMVVEVKPKPASATWDILVVSQWGFHGEYLHLEHEVPEVYGGYREYYSERRHLK